MTSLVGQPSASLTRREWQEFRVEPGGLGAHQVDRLLGLAVNAARQLRLPESAVLARTHRGLRAQQVVGILAIPGVTLEILPKIEGDDASVRGALIRMLSVAYDLRVSEGELSSLEVQRHDFLELLIRLFCDRLLGAVKQGLSRMYLERSEDLMVYRGRLEVKRQLTSHAARPDRLACRFDELSEDTPLNRVVKAAVLRLSRISRSGGNMRLLDELASRLEMARETARPLSEPVRLDRSNAAFHQVYELARLFLSGDWQSTMGGHASGFALLFPMNDLFESYIGRMLRRSVAPNPVRLQDRRHHALQHIGGGGAFALRPDIVIELDHGPLIVDTKWKRLDLSEGTNFGVAQSDVYQMPAYAHAYRAVRLVLLYPWDHHLGPPGLIKRWVVSGTEAVRDAVTVDVGAHRLVPDQLRRLLRV
jgi:5-methylcytosine-specific restriction enzyme subunit McrC